MTDTLTIPRPQAEEVDCPEGFWELNEQTRSCLECPHYQAGRIDEYCIAPLLRGFLGHYLRVDLDAEGPY